MQQGKIKWFSEEKGFGFIYGDDDVDRFVHVSDIQGGELPKLGDRVTFNEENSKRGPKAISVKITSSAAVKPAPGSSRASASNTGGKSTCENCHKSMIPRIITGPPRFAGRRWTPVPIYSVCPFCGSRHQTFNREIDPGGVIVTVLILIVAFFFATNFI